MISLTGFYHSNGFIYHTAGESKKLVDLMTKLVDLNVIFTFANGLD